MSTGSSTEPETRPEAFGGPVMAYNDTDFARVQRNGPPLVEAALAGFPEYYPLKLPENVHFPPAPAAAGAPYVKNLLHGGYTQPDKYPYQIENFRAPPQGPTLDGDQAVVYYNRPGDRFKHYYRSPDGVTYVYNIVTGKYQAEGTRSTTNPNAGAWLVAQPLQMMDNQPPDMRGGTLPTIAQPIAPSIYKRLLVLPMTDLTTNLQTAPVPAMTHAATKAGKRDKEKWQK